MITHYPCCISEINDSTWLTTCCDAPDSGGSGSGPGGTVSVCPCEGIYLPTTLYLLIQSDDCQDGTAREMTWDETAQKWCSGLYLNTDCDPPDELGWSMDCSSGVAWTIYGGSTFTDCCVAGVPFGGGLGATSVECSPFYAVFVSGSTTYIIHE